VFNKRERERERGLARGESRINLSKVKMRVFNKNVSFGFKSIGN
jgi:hypothetical protein